MALLRSLLVLLVRLYIAYRSVVDSGSLGDIS